jgi:hypothetical protein
MEFFGPTSNVRPVTTSGRLPTTKSKSNFAVQSGYTKKAPPHPLIQAHQYFKFMLIIFGEITINPKFKSPCLSLPILKDIQNKLSTLLNDHTLNIYINEIKQTNRVKRSDHRLFKILSSKEIVKKISDILNSIFKIDRTCLLKSVQNYCNIVQFENLKRFIEVAHLVTPVFYANKHNLEKILTYLFTTYLDIHDQCGATTLSPMSVYRNIISGLPFNSPATKCPPLKQCPPPKQCPPAEICPPPKQCPPAETCPPPKQCPPAEICPPPKQCPPAEICSPPKQCPPAEKCPPPEQCPPAEKCPPPEQCPPVQKNILKYISFGVNILLCLIVGILIIIIITSYGDLKNDDIEFNY